MRMDSTILEMYCLGWLENFLGQVNDPKFFMNDPQEYHTEFG